MRAAADEAIALGRDLLGDDWADGIEASAAELVISSSGCGRCGATVSNGSDHRDWHRLLDAGVKLAGALATRKVDIEALGEQLADSFRRHIELGPHG